MNSCIKEKVWGHLSSRCFMGIVITGKYHTFSFSSPRKDFKLCKTKWYLYQSEELVENGKGSGAVVAAYQVHLW